MAKLFWLDDRPDERIRDAKALENQGHDVVLVSSDEEAVDLFERGDVPDVLIQDLHRKLSKAQLSHLAPRPTPGNAHLSGWKFYTDVLRPGLPQVPVIICSVNANQISNRKRADDYNLQILRKGIGAESRINAAVDEVLSAQRTILHDQLSIPHIVTVDFNKVNSALIRHLARKPQDLHRISWANFEVLVGELLKDLGYEVTHTPLSRDGGVDLWAVKKTDLGYVLYAIDTKKYAPTRLVGPEPVRAIHGVADLTGASVGMIVTTSTFGPAARDLANQHRYRISLKDFDDVHEWIRIAGKG